MAEALPNCQLCDGCDDPDCYRDKLEEIEKFAKASQHEMAIQKVRFIEIMKGEQQIKRAGQRLLYITSKIQEMLDEIESQLDNGDGVANAA